MWPWIWKVNTVILVIAFWEPRCSECAQGGRSLTMNEFPYTVFITSNKAPGPRTCLGVIHGSLTIISAAQCFDPMQPNSNTIRTAKNVFSTGQAEVIPTRDLRFSDQQGATFSFAILNLELPGLMVDPFTFQVGTNVTVSPDSTGVKAAEWLMDHTAVWQLTDLGVSGVVPTPDRKVVAMQLIKMQECVQRFRALSPSTRNFANSSDITSDSMCAVSASAPQTHHMTQPIPPGYVCDDDVGSPFIYEDHVIGILVKGYCDNATSAISVFLTLPPSEDINEADDIDSPTTPKVTTFKPLPTETTTTRGTTTVRPHSTGHSIHSGRFFVWIVLSMVILTGKRWWNITLNIVN